MLSLCQAKDTELSTAITLVVEAELQVDCFVKIITPTLQIEKWRQRTLH